MGVCGVSLIFLLSRNSARRRLTGWNGSRRNNSVQLPSRSYLGTKILYQRASRVTKAAVLCRINVDIRLGAHIGRRQAVTTTKVLSEFLSTGRCTDSQETCVVKIGCNRTAHIRHSLAVSTNKQRRPSRAARCPRAHCNGCDSRSQRKRRGKLDHT